MPQSTYMIRVEKGPDAGFTAAVPPGGASLGRSSQNDLVFHDETLSRHHCRIWFDGGIPVVSDLATVNGTYVNGAAIAEDTPISPWHPPPIPEKPAIKSIKAYIIISFIQEFLNTVK